MRIQLLGRFSIRLADADERLIPVPSRRRRALLAYLAMQPGYSETRERLATLLWGDVPDRQARQSLRQALVAMRADFAPFDIRPLRVERDIVGLDPDLIAVDARELLALANSERPEDVEKAAAILQGPFLDGVDLPAEGFTDWLQQQRHRIDTAAATVLGRGAEQADKNGNGPLAIHFAERLSALDPARGSAHRLLLRLSASHRGRDDAMARADSLDKTLRAEFGVGVDTETRALIAEIKAGEFEVNPAGPPRLSILVLPFANIGGAPEQEYFADGVTESLTTDLSRMRGMMVIGRSTAFTYKAKRVDLKQVGRELGVRYVLEGSVQRSGDRMRVNAQLIDVETGKQVWAERFDKNLTGLFDMQDEIVARLANQLGTQMITAEARRAERSPAPDSLDLFFQGMACISRGMTPEYLTQANGYFTRALSLDPGNIEALVYRAYVDTLRVSSYAVDDRAAPIAAAEAALSKALSIVPDHAYAHGFLGYAQIQSKRPIQGIAHCERALELDRNLASAHAVIGLGKSYIGRGEETEAHVLEAMRLSPRDMFASNWLWIAGVAKLYLRQSAEAVVLLQQSIELNRNNVITHIMIASALAHLGRLNEAQLAIKAALGIAPNFNIRRWSEGPYSDHPSYMEQRGWVAEGLRTAGLPE